VAASLGPERSPAGSNLPEGLFYWAEEGVVVEIQA